MAARQDGQRRAHRRQGGHSSGKLLDGIREHTATLEQPTAVDPIRIKRTEKNNKDVPGRSFEKARSRVAASEGRREDVKKKEKGLAPSF